MQSPVFLAHTGLDYAQALGRERSAWQLIAAAARTAAELGLPAVGQRRKRWREADRQGRRLLALPCADS